MAYPHLKRAIDVTGAAFGLLVLAPVIAGYLRENRRYVTLAVGCTGGKHRSVAMTEEVAKRLSKLPRVVVNVEHRDVGRE